MSKPDATALAQNLGGMVYAAGVLNTLANKWKLKARYVEACTWVMHQDDGVVRGVVVCVEHPGPVVDAVAFENGKKWAVELWAGLAVVAGGQVIRLEHGEVFKYFSGPRGLVIDLTEFTVKK